MQNQTLFMVILIMVLASISHCNGDTCYCRCCNGNFCTPTLQGTVGVSSCGSSPCKEACESQYPTPCKHVSGSANYQCTSVNLPTPNWVGVFEIENKCDTSTCCCAVGEVIVSRVSTNALHVRCQFAGQCPSGGSFLDETIAMPVGFTAQILFLNNPILVTLSQNSRTIQFTNPLYPSCGGTATRNGAMSTGTINLALVSLLVGLTSIKQFMM
jgi:hypothetical protein